MNFTRTILLPALIILAAFTVEASGSFKQFKDPLLVPINQNPGKQVDNQYQNKLRSQPYWQEFIKAAGNWSVLFNESSGKPLMAYGEPLNVGGSGPEQVARNFFGSYLKAMNLPMSEFNLESVVPAPKFYIVTFSQKHNGTEVLGTRIQVKMLYDYRVISFNLNYFDGINVSPAATLTPAQAVQNAVQGVGGMVSSVVSNTLSYLPVPGYRKYEYHLVYEVMVSNKDAEGVPGKYYTLVDANSGSIVYRTNRVNHFANTDVTMEGALYVTNPYNPSTVEPLRNLKIVVGGVDFFTDNTGYIGLSNTSSVLASVSLSGLWADVKTNGTTPAWNETLNPGTNTLTADNNTDIKQRTVYHSVNVVHDYMKSKFPAFTGMDNPLESNVDVAGTCNAFYDGTSINFFAAGGGCNATSLVADVCFHEYGHGINDNFYQSIGSSWNNGAMGEGYADLWALGITGSDTLGIGFFSNDPTGYVREYAIDKKVYPQDLVGEVHADGEIIAGCWWDTYKNLGNLQQMMDLFAATFYSGVTDFDGNEGTLYPAILMEAFLADDNDGNLSNGTPNYCAISSGFAIHGITLNGMTGITHNEVLTAVPQAPITIDAQVQGLAAGSTVKGYYRLGGTTTWNLFLLNNTTGSNYQGTLPPQPNGVIVEYYLGIEDDCGTFLGVQPQGANDAVLPNIPYYILVGFNELIYEDFDNFFGSWTTGLPSDQNTTGTWIIDIPIPSFVGNAMVQTDDDFTPGGLFCAVTGNATSANDPAGTEDIDGGATTLESPVYDLTGYTNPAFTYYRWYSNDQGATPGTDFWQVYISGDGVNFVPVENTKVSDHSWRRFAFRVQDYITPTANVVLRFVAEDANAPSLVEGALDDLKLWDETPTGIEEYNGSEVVSVYPNPANDLLNLMCSSADGKPVKIELYNMLGALLTAKTFDAQTGMNYMTIPVTELPAGIYEVKVTGTAGVVTRKFTISR
ncbi:MAG TPA: T9SS type A sorting domain-containing protein [Bacteroidia bacterium]|nr:T9SS type A sorting domain-containing protein [Bacteroidia bacterium]